MHFLFKVLEQKGKSLGSQPIVTGEIFLSDLFLAVSSTSCIIVLLMACTVAREKPIISFLSGGNLIFLCTVTNGPITTIFFFCSHPSVLNISESMGHIERKQGSHDIPNTAATAHLGQHRHGEAVTERRAKGRGGRGRQEPAGPRAPTFRDTVVLVKAALSDRNESRKSDIIVGKTITNNLSQLKIPTDRLLLHLHFNLLEKAVCCGGSF